MVTMNKTRKTKIVTVEDPIEFVFQHERSIITQRGSEPTRHLRPALRAGCARSRRDRGEMPTSNGGYRAQGVEISTGVSSIHTNDVAKTIGFPSSRRRSR
jgi:hypothetical protein